MNHLRRLGNTFSIPIKSDEDGFTGRECPNASCEGYFKIEFGTGLKGEGLPCHCPYCGHTEGHDHFWTKGQIQYAQSVAMRKITDAFHRDLKTLEFDHKPRGAFGIGISMKVKHGRPTPIHFYREQKLETEVVCAHCTLRYSIYGIFAFCPDCGQHNSLQILDKNLEVVGKMLDLAKGAGAELADKLIENALEDCVSAFDGFGRELCRLHASRSSNPGRSEKISFQNLEGARANIFNLFGHDLSGQLDPSEWQVANRGFQKRHVVAHKMGVVDQEYIDRVSDPSATVGRMIAITEDDVLFTVAAVRKIARHLSNHIIAIGNKEMA